jgi:hypothetical protein
MAAGYPLAFSFRQNWKYGQWHLAFIGSCMAKLSANAWNQKEWTSCCQQWPRNYLLVCIFKCTCMSHQRFLVPWYGERRIFDSQLLSTYAAQLTHHLQNWDLTPTRPNFLQSQSCLKEESAEFGWCSLDTIGNSHKVQVPLVTVSLMNPIVRRKTRLSRNSGVMGSSSHDLLADKDSRYRGHRLPDVGKDVNTTLIIPVMPATIGSAS